MNSANLFIYVDVACRGFLETSRKRSESGSRFRCSAYFPKLLSMLPCIYHLHVVENTKQTRDCLSLFRSSTRFFSSANKQSELKSHNISRNCFEFITRSLAGFLELERKSIMSKKGSDDLSRFSFEYIFNFTAKIRGTN